MSDRRLCAVILAAGASQRMGEDKLLMRFGGTTPLEVCTQTFLDCTPHFDEIILVVSDATRAAAQSIMRRHGRIRLVQGGAHRGESVYNALKLATADIVAIHDCARCLVSEEVIARTVRAAVQYGSGVASIPARDTLHTQDCVVPREGIYMAQTPQTFLRRRIMRAYELAVERDEAATDDCALYRAAGYEPHFTEGSIVNQKLTGRGDIPMFEALLGGTLRTGYGEDTHRLVEGRALVLGGVTIPHTTGLLGHSDADVLTHAVIDALLGAAGLGDIGRQFPDSVDSYKDICSLILLERTAEMVRQAGYRIGNIDATVIAQSPRLAPYIADMRENIARYAGVDGRQVSVKASTTEGLGPEGRGEGMSARCVCTLMTCR